MKESMDYMYIKQNVGQSTMKLPLSRIEHGKGRLYYPFIRYTCSNDIMPPLYKKKGAES